MAKPESYVAIDFDGTLATYDSWKGHEHTGDPVRPMIDRVKSLLDRGIKVKVFTARVYNCPEAIPFVKEWIIKHIGVELEITNVKDHGMMELFDDRCIAIERNTGAILGGSSRFFKDVSQLDELKRLCKEAEPIVSIVCPTLGAAIREAIKR